MIALVEEDTSLEEFTDVPIDSGDFVHVQKTNRGAIFFSSKGKRFVITYIVHEMLFVHLAYIHTI